MWQTNWMIYFLPYFIVILILFGYSLELNLYLL